MLIDLLWSRKIDPGKVFDLSLPLDQVAEAAARWTSSARSRRCCALDCGDIENTAANHSLLNTCVAVWSPTDCLAQLETQA